MSKYEFKKVKGYQNKKFIEDGHTMFEEDVLQRLKRLSYLEEHIKYANYNREDMEASFEAGGDWRIACKNLTDGVIDKEKWAEEKDFKDFIDNYDKTT